MKRMVETDTQQIQFVSEDEDENNIKTPEFKFLKKERIISGLSKLHPTLNTIRTSKSKKGINVFETKLSNSVLSKLEEVL